MANNKGNNIMANNTTQKTKTHKSNNQHKQTKPAAEPPRKKIDIRFLNEKPGDRELKIKKTSTGIVVIRLAVDSLLANGSGKFFAAVAHQVLISKKIVFDLSAIHCIPTDEELKILFTAYKKIVLKEGKVRFLNINHSVLHTFSDKNMLNIFKIYGSLKDIEESYQIK